MTAIWHDVRRYWELNVSDQLTIDALEQVDGRRDAHSCGSRGANRPSACSSASLTPLPGATNGGSDLPAEHLPAEPLGDGTRHTRVHWPQAAPDNRVERPSPTSFNHAVVAQSLPGTRATTAKGV